MLVPPNFDPAPGFPEAQEIAAMLKSALETARPGRVVYLSTIGAQAMEPKLLTQHTAARMVHRKFQLGRRASARKRSDFEFPPAR